MKKFGLYKIIGIYIFLNSACHLKPEVKVKEQSIIIPNHTIFVKNSAINFHQDTLFLGAKKYSGFVLDTFPTEDSASFVGYFNGIEEGVSKKWHPNKQIAEVRFFHHGKKIGIHRGFWPNGNRKFEYHFVNGEHHGKAQDWYENGQVYKEFHYKMGYEEGSQKAWWENGIIRANYVVKNGRRYGLIGLKLCMNPDDSLKINQN